MVAHAQMDTSVQCHAVDTRQVPSFPGVPKCDHAPQSIISTRCREFDLVWRVFQFPCSTDKIKITHWSKVKGFQGERFWLCHSGSLDSSSIPCNNHARNSSLPIQGAVPFHHLIGVALGKRSLVISRKVCFWLTSWPWDESSPWRHVRRYTKRRTRHCITWLYTTACTRMHSWMHRTRQSSAMASMWQCSASRLVETVTVLNLWGSPRVRWTGDCEKWRD